MKYIVIIGDGMADFPLVELGGKTPLMNAHKPYMNMMAGQGYCGRVMTIPDGFPPGSDVAAMSIFGYNPAEYYTGRAPIEAAGMNIAMESDDVACRCNLVNLEFADGKIFMGDFSGGHITTDEAKILLADLNGTIGKDKRFSFYPGVSYRHLMMWRGGAWEMETTPPHDIMKQQIDMYLPRGSGADVMITLMEKSREILKDHPVNVKRTALGKLPANSIWLWGQGKKTYLPSFMDRYHLQGATVAAVDLIKGVSKLVGFDAPFVEGATGYTDTDYLGKANKALELLETKDIVYIHVEAPDEASHNGDFREKIRAIESIDKDIVGTIFEQRGKDIRFLILTDHATPIVMRTHYACPVPFIIFGKDWKYGNGCRNGYTEDSGNDLFNGESLVRFFLKGEK